MSEILNFYLNKIARLRRDSTHGSPAPHKPLLLLAVIDLFEQGAITQNRIRALWEDTVFPDGATARGLANLPQNINDHLKELNTQGKRHGGLHAASGTLGSGASGSVRLALLRIIFKSADLPELYPVARFIMRLKSHSRQTFSNYPNFTCL